MKPFIFLILCFYLLLLQSFSFAAAASLEEACKKVLAVDYGFCVTSLQVDPASRSANTKGLALIAAKLTKANSTSIMSKIDELVKKGGVGPVFKKLLLSCSRDYSDVARLIGIALNYIKVGDLHSANITISAIVDVPVDCEYAFTLLKKKSPLTKEDDDFVKLAGIFLGFTVLLG